ncbi:MAG: hypothetical protein KF886_26865 [Candidatus Hydrogenedentes bacterium]|nr:hypothetical protein [Candidatus Hydrogenedentota bacterium]
MDTLPDGIAVIVIDHGSRMAAANDMLNGVVHMYRQATGVSIVEPAHMELAEPTLEQAAERCIAQGAATIIVHPYFLAPGRHSTSDIPGMVEDLAPRYPGVRFHITNPLGIDPGMAAVMHRRILEALGTA